MIEENSPYNTGKTCYLISGKEQSVRDGRELPFYTKLSPFFLHLLSLTEKILLFTGE